MVKIPAYERNDFNIVKCLICFGNLLGCDLQSDVCITRLAKKKNGFFLAELVELKKKFTGEI